MGLLPRVYLPRTASSLTERYNSPAGPCDDGVRVVGPENAVNPLRTVAVAVTALAVTINCASPDRLDSEELMVPMRDGVRLRTKITRPGLGRYPVVLIRGYDTDFWGGISSRFLDARYVFVGQATRGHLGSEGDQGMDNRFFDDAQDGYDAIDWISRQPWCDGNVAMYGSSYYGATQWLAAPEAHPNLKAIVPQNVGPDPWLRMYRDHGAIQLAHTARRIHDYSPEAKQKVEQFGWWNWYRHLPLITLDTVAGTRPNKLYNAYVSHSTYDDFWKAIGTRHKLDKIRIPVYLMSGWYDNYPGATLEYFEKLTGLGATDEIRVAISPTTHTRNRVVGDRDFGDDAEKDEIGLAIRWLNSVIKGEGNGIRDEPKVRLFVMGVNEWRLENEWPLARTQFTKYYFRADGDKDGSLNTNPPKDGPPTRYTYDPDDPVLTLGGNHSATEIPGIFRAGPVDQRSNEGRSDVLTFTSQPMAQDLEVTGPIVVKLYAASSARDTDFIARLIDVYPDGRAFNLTEGIIRARFRKSIWEPPRLLEPGKIYEYTINLLPTANVFLKGHRIRAHITSSNFPMWDRNPNTGNEQGMDAELKVAEQTIYHDGERPSHILLPVILANGCSG